MGFDTDVGFLEKFVRGFLDVRGCCFARDRHWSFV